MVALFAFEFIEGNTITRLYLGAKRPNTWTLFVAGTLLALVAAAILTLVIPRLYPLEPGRSYSRDEVPL